MVSSTGQRYVIKFCKAIFDCYKAIISLYVHYLLPLFVKEGNDILPDLKDELLLLPATILAQKIRQQNLKSEDVVKAYIARIKEVNPIINAVVETRFDKAIQEARAVDTYIKTSNKTEAELAKERPLLGLPITIKSNVSCEGMTYDLGLVTRKGMKADKSAEVKTRLDESGAIQLVLSNTPELCASLNTNNNVYGQTRNPYNLSRSSGGSSGGEGALVSSAASIIGIGNDMAGSIRIPACLNGIFGHKPTIGIVSSNGIFPYSKAASVLLTNGPMCRYAGDMRLALSCMAGDNASKLNLDTKVDIKKLKIFFWDDDIGCPFICPITDEVRQTVRKTVNYFEKEYGIKSERLNIPKIKHSMSIFSVKSANVMDRSLASMLGNEDDKEIDVGTEIFKSFFGMSRFTLPSLFFALCEKLTPKKTSSWYGVYQKIEDSLQKDFDNLLNEENTIMIFPSFPDEAPRPVESISKLHALSYFCLFNVLGLPVTQVPIGLSRNKLPLGVQIIAGKLKDYLTIAIAEELEKVFGGWKCPGTI